MQKYQMFAPTGLIFSRDLGDSSQRFKPIDATPIAPRSVTAEKAGSGRVKS